MRNKKKHMLDRKMRNRLKRKFAKENLGSIIGRPKKPPLLNSEKIDGTIINTHSLLLEGGSKIYTCHVLGCGKIFSDSSSLRKHLMTHGERQVSFRD
jgi:hypothetical protein